MSYTKQTSATAAYINWASGARTSSTTSETSDAKDVSAVGVADVVGAYVIATAAASVAPSLQLAESPDGGTNYYQLPTKVFAPGSTATGTYPFAIPLQPGTTHVKLVNAGGTAGGGGSITLTAEISTLS